METVFDYNITDEEREHIGLSYAKNADEYAPFDEVAVNMDLASLFWLRGDKKKTIEYTSRLPPYARFDFFWTVVHPLIQLP